MIVTANPYASDVGANILLRGGTAADAMVAAQAVLGLVEPQSSGMGGGGFLVWYDSKSGELTTLDGRETAPMAASDHLFRIKMENRSDFGTRSLVVVLLAYLECPLLWNWLTQNGEKPLGEVCLSRRLLLRNMVLLFRRDYRVCWTMSPYACLHLSKQNPTSFQTVSHWLTARC